MKAAAFAAAILLACPQVGAQKVEVTFQPVDGPPCTVRNQDRQNSYNAPVQRNTYAARVSQLKAVIVAGSGTRYENMVVESCAQDARARLDQGRAFMGAEAFRELYGRQVRECIGSRDRRIRVYQVLFQHEDRCLPAALR